MEAECSFAFTEERFLDSEECSFDFEECSFAFNEECSVDLEEFFFDSEGSPLESDDFLCRWFDRCDDLVLREVS